MTCASSHDTSPHRAVDNRSSLAKQTGDLLRDIGRAVFGQRLKMAGCSIRGGETCGELRPASVPPCTQSPPGLINASTTRQLMFLIPLAFLVTACATSPTGQKQLRLFPDQEMSTMGIAAFEQVKKDTPETTDPRILGYIQCVASRVIEQTGNANWEVRVFESPQVNAFALPGGKIGVYTGLLDVATNQDQLAAVIGHEITHVTAEHGNARVSAAYATQAGLELAQVMAGAPTPQKQQLLGLLGLGAQYGVLLPYGRAQETEADLLGLDLMASAGFDPRAAVELWRNMATVSGDKQPAAFLSTHPSHEDRIRRLNERMPEALALYETARQKGNVPSCKP